ncbi:Hexaprenyldihydroxybenzoate methyltransferase, mitochondrial [Xylographa trunciseda]|nr:Hexaprenyldihydroxybenzoate methyltransferase, mitochondrial [Xylographa trunciseda]
MAIRGASLRILPLLSKTSSSRYYSSSPSPTSSVNPTEVSHFNALASTWWDPHGSSRLLHLMNPLRHDFIMSCLASQKSPTPSHKLRYLDVGCGGGIFAESAARLGNTASVTGIDPSAEVLKIAQEHARQDPMLHQSGRLQYLNKSVEGLPIPQNVEEQFDVLTLFEVIEHINQPAPFLQSCLPFVKPGGWLVMSTIARTWTSWLTTKFVAEEIVRLVPRGTHEWSKYVNESEMRKFFQDQKGWANKGAIRAAGCMYVPGLGWRMVSRGEQWGNYFFGVRKNPKPSED